MHLSNTQKFLGYFLGVKMNFDACLTITMMTNFLLESSHLGIAAIGQLQILSLVNNLEYVLVLEVLVESELTSGV